MSFDTAKPRVGGERTNISDLFDTHALTNTWSLVRFLDKEHLTVANHWIDITTKEGNKTRFPKICLSWDGHKEEDVKGVTCPYCKAGLSRNISYYMNAIVRDIQEEEPAKPGKPTEEEAETGLKTKGSKAWTPVRVIQLTSTLVAKIQGLRELNTHKVDGKTKAFAVSDNKYGMDVNLKYNEKEKAASNKYSLNTGDKSSISKEEKVYLTWDLGDPTLLKRLGQETEDQAKIEIKRFKANGLIGKEEDSDEDDDDYNMNSKKSRHDDEDDDDYKPKKGKSRSFDDDDEDDEPKKGKKKSRSFDDDEDDEDDRPKKKKRSFDDDDDDEDDKPKKKGKSKVDDDEDDEDEDDKPKKKGKSKVEDDEDDRPKKKKRSFDDDEDDEDDRPKKKKRSFDDEDEDDKPKKKGKSKVDDDEDDEDDKPKKGKKKRSFDDDDDDY